MRIMQVNSVPYGSTGRIMFALADCAIQAGHTVFCTTGFSWHRMSHQNYFLTSGIFEKELHTVLAKCTGYNGHFSSHATKRLIHFLDIYQPDVLHLHNLHGWYLNLPMFFHYIKENDIPVVWTLHDCWTFTGQCAHFQFVACDKWRKSCGDCPQKDRYPQSWIDRSRYLLEEKRSLFTGMKNVTIVTPSQWLAEVVKQSFLNEYPVQVIPNGIDLEIFYPQKQNIRQQLGLEGKQIVLGVSLGWDNRKGIDTFIELSQRLSAKYQIVLVGTENCIEKILPNNILSFHRTHNCAELAALYSAADVFVNPTREDTFPTVNLEALACGTPVITFDCGGSPECIDMRCGSVVPTGDIDAMQREIERICTEKPYSETACRERAKRFNADEQFKQYIDLYQTVLERATTKRAGTAGAIY